MEFVVVNISYSQLSIYFKILPIKFVFKYDIDKYLKIYNNTGGQVVFKARLNIHKYYTRTKFVDIAEFSFLLTILLIITNKRLYLVEASKNFPNFIGVCKKTSSIYKSC